MTSPCGAGRRLPVTRKCCFCVPVRRGVIIFAYINLVLSLLSLPLLVFLLVEQATTAEAGADVGGEAGGAVGTAVMGRMHLSLSVAWVLADTALTVMLLIAAHKKQRRALLVYVCAGALLQAVMLLGDLVYFDARLHLQNVVYFIFLGLNVYQLYLVWSVAQRIALRHTPPPSPPPVSPPTRRPHTDRPLYHVVVD